MSKDSQLNILIVSWSFPPAKNPKAVKTEAIVTELLRLGHYVSLLTRIEHQYTIDKSIEKRLEQLEVIPWKDWPKFTVNLTKSENWFSVHKYKRLFNGLMLKLFAYPNIQAFFEVKYALNRFDKNYDLCLSVDGPQQMHWAIAHQKTRGKLRFETWIADCGDPLTRLLEGNKVAPYFKLVENWFCEKTDFITVPVEQGFNYFLPKYKSKIHLVRHSLLFPEKENNTTKISKETGVPTFAYVGNMMPYLKEARSFFSFLNNLKEDFQFETIGGNEPFIKELLHNNPNLKNKVRVHGKRERFNLLKDMRRYDFLVYLKFSGTHQVSFKLIDYDFAGIPVIEWSNNPSDKDIFLNFLRSDYSKRMKLKSFQGYKSSSTVKKYLELVKSK